MEFPLEEGYVYGQAPKEPSKPPDIHAVFEAVGVPKGKLGELPYPKDWYDGAKERARLRAIELEELYAKKNDIRQEWVHLVLADCEDQVDQVDRRLVESGPVLGLAELLARAALERPEAEDRIERLQERASKAAEDQERLRFALDAARMRLVTNADAIRKREGEDLSAEQERVEEKRAEEARKRKGEKILARQAAMLRGEEVPPDSDEDDDEGANDDARGEGGQQRVADDSANEGRPGVAHMPPSAPRLPPSGPAAPKSGIASPPSLAGQPYPASFLGMRVASPSPHPSPELRGGLARQLPPIQSLSGRPPS